MLDDSDISSFSRGLRKGFSYFLLIDQAETDNYFSATNPFSKDTVESSILEKIEAGNYAVSTNKPIIISALGAVQKPDSDEFDLIHDC